MPKVTTRPTKNLPVKPAPKRRAGKYLMPDPLPNGEILTDLSKKEWKLGPSIGKGGFGEIYSATDVASGKNSYVIKIEPKENGPLFVEMHFFMKVCKSDDIDKWMKSKELKFLGLPRFVGNGSHQHNGKQYRFVVMEKYGKNLDAVLKENKNILPSDQVFLIALQIIDVLEYIHSKGYVHADIKGGNLLLGLSKGTDDKVYVVDFGLASKYPSDFKPDPKCAHNGTIEFTSRDAHVGATTRRGDLEILAYNILRWLTARLPWEDKLTDCSYVQQQKIQYMRNIPELMKKCFETRPVPEAVKKYFEYVSNMPPTGAPDYDLCRHLFQEGLKKQVTSVKNTKISSPTRKTVQVSSQNAKKPETKKKSEQDKQKVERRQKSPTKVSVEKTPDKVTRSVRAVRKVNHIANGYVPESDSFSEDDDDSDFAYEGDEDYQPGIIATKHKPVKRRNNKKNVVSPKKKRSL